MNFDDLFKSWKQNRTIYIIFNNFTLVVLGWFSHINPGYIKYNLYITSLLGISELFFNIKYRLIFYDCRSCILSKICCFKCIWFQNNFIQNLWETIFFIIIYEWDIAINFIILRKRNFRIHMAPLPASPYLKRNWAKIFGIKLHP